jgi:5'-nucleotidase/UDP-sugar diphosphatase
VRAAGVSVVGGNARDHATGQPFADAVAHVKLGARNAVVVGITTDRLSTFRVAVRPSLDLSDPIVWAKENLPPLLKAAPLPIVMTHTGVKVDRAILPLLPDGTLFAGAHDHLRFVHREGRTVYFHSGSWTEFLSIARLRKSATGLNWEIEQVRIAADDPADEKLAALVRETMAKHLTAEETAVVGRCDRAFSSMEAALCVVEAVRHAAGADAAVIGGTTFGAGLPAGDVSRFALDACVRFDGALFVGELSGTQLQKIMARANLGPDAPFAAREGENLIAVASATIEPQKTYRIVTTDWGAKNAKNYFGDAAPVFVERPGLKLKAAVIAALNPPHP